MEQIVNTAAQRKKPETLEHYSVQNVSLDKWTNIIHAYKPKTEAPKEKASQDNYVQNGGA